MQILQILRRRQLKKANAGGIESRDFGLEPEVQGTL